MLAVREAKEGAPTRFVRNPAFQPEFVDTVAGSVTITFQDAIQTKEYLIRLPRLLNLFCEPQRTRGIGTDQRPVRPFGPRPILRRIENRLVTGIPSP